ncbi:MAG TPA: PadR family transcriptional regulator [Conexibacter sp.]|nr:PadR family transcriptional regulator [Conexibacter sp.]
MGAAHIDLARGRLRELRGATLALIVERPGHGYELASRLNRRLGPTWQVEPKVVYSILDDFAQAGLVRTVEEPNPDRPRQRRVVYHSTERAPGTLHRWMRSGFEAGPVRPDVVARIASATPGDAPELLRVLDDYEGELLRLLEANDDADPPVRSWRSLLLAIARGHTDSYLQGEFQWVVVTRRRIREFMAEQ